MWTLWLNWEFSDEWSWGFSSKPDPLPTPIGGPLKWTYPGKTRFQFKFLIFTKIQENGVSARKWKLPVLARFYRCWRDFPEISDFSVKTGYPQNGPVCGGSKIGVSFFSKTTPLWWFLSEKMCRHWDYIPVFWEKNSFFANVSNCHACSRMPNGRVLIGLKIALFRAQKFGSFFFAFPCQRGHFVRKNGAALRISTTQWSESATSLSVVI